MKKILFLFSVLMATVIIANGQCNEIFFSEYVEGSHNNKALELYNPTANPINLSGYQLVRYSNGGTTPYAVAISGIIQPYSTFVTVLDKTDTNATGMDTAVFAELLALADTLLCPVYNVNRMHYFNGDDAVTIEPLGGGSYIDIIGKIGEDPGFGWTNDTSAGFTDANGGRWWTRNHTMIRKHTVEGGVTQNPNYFVAAAEWDTLPNNTFDHLGWHICDCDPTSSIVKIKPNDAFFYPNPVTGKELNVKGTTNITKVEIITLSGKVIQTEINTRVWGEIKIQLAPQVTSGLYLTRVFFDDGSAVTKKCIIR